MSSGRPRAALGRSRAALGRSQRPCGSSKTLRLCRFQRFVYRQSYFLREQLNVQHIPLDFVFEVALGAAGGLLGVPGGALGGS